MWESTQKRIAVVLVVDEAVKMLLQMPKAIPAHQYLAQQYYLKCDAVLSTTLGSKRVNEKQRENCSKCVTVGMLEKKKSSKSRGATVLSRQKLETSDLFQCYMHR